MKKIIYLLAVSLPLFFTACDNDDVEDSGEATELIQFPQGTNSYDNEFVEFFNTYGTQTLYKFGEADFRWAVSSYLPYYASQADEAYVAAAWKVLRDDCISVWPENVLREWLPYRILLASKIWYYTKGYDADWNYVTIEKTQNAVYGYNHVALALANADVENLTAVQRRQWVGDFAYALVGYAASKGLVSIPSEYQTLFNTWKNSFGEDGGFYQNATYGYNCAGCLESMSLDNYDINKEFALYVKYLVMMTDEDFQTKYLDSSFDCGVIMDWSTYTPTDSQPVRQKYEVVKKYFKNELGIDLSAIGAKTAQIQ